MASDGQQTLDGGEVTDPRITKAGQALWWEDARRTWGRDGREPDGTLVATSKARQLWPRMQRHYEDTARVALTAAGVL
jgi:hypothetical protein